MADDREPASPIADRAVQQILSAWSQAKIKPNLADLCSHAPELLGQVEKQIQQLMMTQSSPPASGSRAVSARFEPAAPGRIGQYHLLEKLGEGGMGVVRRAHDQVLDRDVAIKVLKSPAPKALTRFIREAKATAKLNHPNIISIYHVLEVDPDVHIVMELLQHSLANELEREGALPWPKATQAVRDAAAGLAVAHQAGLVHRDVKPSNLLRTVHGAVKVADFGLVHTGDTSSTMVSCVIAGTPAFMSPEQGRGDSADARSDIYSLGCTYYTLVTGRPPFEGGSALAVIQKHCQEVVPDPRALVADLPEMVSRIIAKATYKHAGDRYGTAAAMLVDLQSLLAEADKGAVRRRIVIAYKRHAQPDGQVLALLENRLRALGHEVFIDRHLTIGVQWAQEIEQRIREADAVVPLLSAASMQSEMLAYELQVARAAAGEGSGKPRILPVRVRFEGPLPPELAGVIQSLQYFLWKGPEDDKSVVDHVHSALQTPQRRIVRGEKLESVGGAMPLESKFYLPRRTDQQFLDAVARRDAIVLIKGARQTGKTSLLARGLQHARQTKVTTAVCDFQKLTAEQLETPETFYMALGDLLVDQLDLDVRTEDNWDARRAPNMNFDRFLRRDVLNQIAGPLVWALDEVDRLFGCPFGGEVFALFRTWHNERALDPSGPWGRLTLAIAYATEAHLFIRDVNQSPFNVGTRLSLQDFTLDQVGELNGRYGSPLQDGTEVSRFCSLVGGQPFLVQRGLHEMTGQGLTIEEFEARADQEDGPYGDHLRRILVMLARDAALLEVMRGLLRGQRCPDVESFYRLQAAGLVSGPSGASHADLRCNLYKAYLGRHLL